MIDSDIKMVFLYCRCCNQDADKCKYINRLKKFGIGNDNDILNALSYELEVPNGSDQLDW